MTKSDYCDSIDYVSSLFLKGIHMEYKIFESEMKVMELIWENEPVSAKEISLLASERIGWNKNTTYTVIKKLEAKGYIKRSEPGFICTSLISRGEVERSEARGLVKRIFGGSKKALFSALLDDEDLTDAELDELREMIKNR